MDRILAGLSAKDSKVNVFKRQQILGRRRDLKTVESRDGEDVLELLIASGYLSKLTRNPGIKRYLCQHPPHILTEFNAIISATSLDQSSSTA
jgi:hypothetical protein